MRIVSLLIVRLQKVKVLYYGDGTIIHRQNPKPGQLGVAISFAFHPKPVRQS